MHVAQEMGNITSEHTEVNFVALHGTPVLADRRTGTWICPDGAEIRHNPQGGNFLVEPPNDKIDPKGSLLAKRRFHTCKASLAAQAFEQLKAVLLGRSQTLSGRFEWDRGMVEMWGPAPIDHTPGPTGRAALRKLDELHGIERAAIKAIDKEIYDLPENVEARRRRDAVRARKEAIERDVSDNRGKFEMEVEAMKLTELPQGERIER